MNYSTVKTKKFVSLEKEVQIGEISHLEIDEEEKLTIYTKDVCGHVDRAHILDKMSSDEIFKLADELYDLADEMAETMAHVYPDDDHSEELRKMGN